MIGLIVEDKNTEVIEEICRVINVKCKIRRQRGKISIKNATSYIKDLFKYNCEKILVLSDADCNEEGERRRLQRIYTFVPNDIKNRVHICIIRNEIECWVLADENALTNFFRSKIQEIENPESLHDGKEKLEEIFKKHDKNYYSKSLKEIAGKLDIDRVRKKASSFNDFYNIVNDC
ncbi:MAG: DUF4276 family protein [Candidatus Thermoplasmatota archaeon]